MSPALPSPLLSCCLIGAALIATALPSPPPAKEKAARLGIQLQVLPDCKARPNAEGCLQPAARRTEGSRDPEQISGLSPTPEPDNEAAPPVITRTW